MGVNVRKPGRERGPLGQHQASDHPGEGAGIAGIVLEGMLEMCEHGLIHSGGVPSGAFGLHKQKVSPTGDAFSYFLSGDQALPLCLNPITGRLT
jgi:hypothetical protein